MFVSINLHVTTSKIFKEQVNSSSSIILRSLLGITATFDNLKEFVKLNHFRSIVINGLNNLLDLLAIINKSKSD